jgi:type I restriction enzyme, R subunit
MEQHPKIVKIYERETEADTCRKEVLPKIKSSGWSDEQILEQRTFTAGEIIVIGRKAKREKAKKFDYLLRYDTGFPIAIVEAKVKYKTAKDGLQQAKEYAHILGLTFCYATNGTEIIEFDFSTGFQQSIKDFPSPQELYERLKVSKNTYLENWANTENATLSNTETNNLPSSKQVLSENEANNKILLSPFFYNPDKPIIPSDKSKPIRYFQIIAINKAVQAILEGQKRVLLTLATGTGKTVIASQIVHKLWKNRWNLAHKALHPKVLFIADRTVLVSEPMIKDFAIFKEANLLVSTESFNVSGSGRDIYFSTYQALEAKDSDDVPIYKKFKPDFFDLIVIDECHRGSANEEGNWRAILNYFSAATHLGLTATPLRDESRDTYNYFGNPIYIYTLKQGLQDGFLAPYILHRVSTNIDAQHFRPQDGQRDRYGRIIPDKIYKTEDFERIISFRNRTEIVATHLTNFLRQTERLAKTIVFCEDQAHAADFVELFGNLNADLMRVNPNYVVRITSDEKDIGKKMLSEFMDVETRFPTVAVTSRLMSTGVDVPTCANIVIFRIVNSMSEFKQIVGRGTRVRDDKGKLFFTMLDYTGSAFDKFHDPEFEGQPPFIIDEETGGDTEGAITDPLPPSDPPLPPLPPTEPRKLYVDNQQVNIVAESVHVMMDGKLRTIQYTEYAREQVIKLFPDATSFREQWLDHTQRALIYDILEEHNLSIENLRELTKIHDADAFDLLCYVAYNFQPKSRKERATLVRQNGKDFFESFPEKARHILTAILDKYEIFGENQLNDLSTLLKIKPLSDYGTVNEIASVFGGVTKLKSAILELQANLYAA